MIKKTVFGRNPNIGVFCKANNRFILVPKNSPKIFFRDVKETFEEDVYKVNVSGTSLIGVMISLNDKGLILPKNIFEDELKEFKDLDINVGVLNDKMTALGNLILANDNGGIVNPDFRKESIKMIEDVLDIEVETGLVGGFRALGSIGIATNKGALIHPMVSEDELEWIESILKVEVDVGTVNRGVGFVKTGLVANSRGAIMGSETTGPEIARLEDVLGFLG
jgi:translation initiation factor 6